ncbi:response regulator receiver domain protein [Calothrix parasitica NIES-267]|uniref:Response regulator receiver domain protein n=1 Tax=Calothrix parasitica NIES-267 TaxID=1973488 RepID=A0A1Z4LXH4_9CYAN|nr:response regulator receiver domain protein [Calothrix parasitica NIES-267]
MQTVNHRRIVLVIENEDALQELTQLCLETVLGWEVLTANSVNEAIVKATTERVNAILVDLNEIIFDFDWKTISQLQNNPKTEQIPIILLTTTEQYKQLPQLSEFGVTAAIIKPFDLSTLATQVAAALNWE